MADPNSVTTRVRMIMVRWLDPSPDPGEAWCMECSLHGGRTLILNATGHEEHLGKHREVPGREYIAMRVNYGSSRPGEEP